jgi:hypothetical protein
MNMETPTDTRADLEWDEIEVLLDFYRERRHLLGNLCVQLDGERITDDGPIARNLQFVYQRDGARIRYFLDLKTRKDRADGEDA